MSAAALLSDGLTASTQISCENSFTVGGQTFTSDGSGEEKPFSADFADGCGTAFAGVSERLGPGQFDQVVTAFGIGAKWSPLPVPLFSGSVPSGARGAALAAETIGQGNVLVSPLSMAMVAAEVDSGSWHAPQVVAGGTAENPANPVSRRGWRSRPAPVRAARPDAQRGQFGCGPGGTPRRAGLRTGRPGPFRRRAG